MTTQKTNEEIKEYKIELKPTWWEVRLSQGSYSDYIDKELYFRANSEEEVWHFLVRYLEDIYDEEDYSRIKGVIYGNKKARVDGKTMNKPGEGKFDWEAGYGEAHRVEYIKQLKVIHFAK